MDPNDPKQSLSAPDNLVWKRLYLKTGPFLSRKPFLVSFLATVLLVFPILSVFRIYFQLNDDNFVLFLFKGLGLNWAPSAFNQRENILLCYLLKSLYVN